MSETRDQSECHMVFTLRPFIHCGAALGMVRDAQVDRQTSGDPRCPFLPDVDVDVVVDSLCLFQT